MVCRSFTCGILTILLAAHTLRADVPNAPAPALDPAADPAIERTLSIIDVVLEHHISPPTRQEMVLRAAQAAYRHAKVPAPVQLGRRLSTLTTRDDFRQFLRATWKEVARTGTSQESRELGDTLAHAAIDAADGDPRLLPTKEANVQEQLQGNRYVGIGIALGYDEGAGLPQIHPLPDGPADRSGIRNDELIVSIDGQPMAGKKPGDVVDLLRGPAGTQVTLELKPSQIDDRNTRTVTITRGLVPQKTIRGLLDTPSLPNGCRVKPGEPVAYVRTHQIGGSLAHELERLEPQLEAAGFQALIIDLRSVDRGDLHHAVVFIDAFLDGGKFGRVRAPAGLQEFTADRECIFRDWPLAILVDEHTGGTAEWAAAALQDRRRATIVGTTTAGQAFVKSFVPVPGGNDSLQIPTGILERASGASLARSPRPRTDLAHRGDGQEPAELHRADGGVVPDSIVAPPSLPRGRTAPFVVAVGPRQTAAVPVAPTQAPPGSPARVPQPAPPIANIGPEVYISQAYELLREQLESRSRKSAK